MNDIAHVLPPHSNKGDEYDMADWNIRSKWFYEDYIFVATKDGLPESMKYDRDNKDTYYHPLSH